MFNKFQFQGLILVALVATLFGCSRTKDSFTSRTYHRMTAKFNPLFNGEQAFIQGVDVLEGGLKNDYEKLLSVYPIGSEAESKSIEADMDRTIEKCIKVIQNHSMVIKGDQKNGYVMDAYLLLAKAHFYKRDYFKALEGFNYVIRNFSKSEDHFYEAQWWAGRTLNQIGNLSSSRTTFEAIYQNRKLPSYLEGQVGASYAELEIIEKNYLDAATYLQYGIEHYPTRDLKERWTYLLAQLYEKQGERTLASETFQKVVRMHPVDYEMYLSAQLKRALNFDPYAGDIKEVFDDLDDLIDDDKNIEYRDRIYYTKGLIYLDMEEFSDAEVNFKKSIRSSVNNRTQKGLSYLKLAEVNFKFKSYVTAQAYYDSTYQNLPQNHDMYKIVERYRSSLNDLVEQIRTIETNDSLIKLAGMSEVKQRKIFEEYIAQLKEKEAAEKEAAALKALNSELAAQSASMAGGPQVGGGVGQWYFYNETVRGSGLSAFQSKWGNRKLEDHWRRSQKMMIVEAAEEEETAESTENAAQGNEITGEMKYDVQAYLSNVPKTEGDIEACHSKIRKAYLRMAAIYRDEIKDVPEAIRTYEKMLKRYPENDDLALIYYALYRGYLAENNKKESDKYKNLLMFNYPTSSFAAQLNGSAEKNASDYELARASYEEAYKLYEKKNYKGALKGVETFMVQYPKSTLMPRAELLRALCLAQTSGAKAYIDALNEVIAKYPDTPESALATNMLLHSGEEESAGKSDDGKYTYLAVSPHSVMIMMPSLGVNTNDMRNAIANFNTKEFSGKTLNVKNVILDNSRQLTLILGFKNAQEAADYRKKVAVNGEVVRATSGAQVKYYVISDENFKVFFKDKDVSGYDKFHMKFYSK